MPRKIVVQMPDGTRPILEELPAGNELELQDLMKDNPALLPIDDFELVGPPLVVGRETTVASGAIDLACIARGGQVLLIEFKTGPQNTDFRHSIAQLLDYGSHIWQQDLQEFERLVALRFFNDTARCTDPILRGKSSLQESALATWPDMTPENFDLFAEQLTSCLASGSFTYVLVAQRFTEAILKTIDYMNFVVPNSNFYAVELVKFSFGDFSAFESRKAHGPQLSVKQTSTVANEAGFTAGLADSEYANAIQELFEAARGLAFRFGWGAAGVSIRYPTSLRPEPITVMWVYPPGRSGWSGLRDVSLGFDGWTADQVNEARPYLERYLQDGLEIPGSDAFTGKTVRAAHFSPAATVTNLAAIVECLARLKEQMP